MPIFFYDRENDEIEIILKFSEIIESINPNYILRLRNGKCINITEYNDIFIRHVIIVVISNFEKYFSTIFEMIFNDKEVKYNENFTRFLDEFKLKQRFQAINNGFSDESFGAFIIENKKINCQNLQQVKDILKLLFDIDMCKISEKLNIDWNKIDLIFDARHILIHKMVDIVDDIKKFMPDVKKIKQKDKGVMVVRITDIYDKTRILNDMNDISNILHKIDKELFSIYELE